MALLYFPVCVFGEGAVLRCRTRHNVLERGVAGNGAGLGVLCACVITKTAFPKLVNWCLKTLQPCFSLPPRKNGKITWNCRRWCIFVAFRYLFITNYYLLTIQAYVFIFCHLTTTNSNVYFFFCSGIIHFSFVLCPLRFPASLSPLNNMSFLSC